MGVIGSGANTTEQVVGGALGGVIGKQFGKGKGKEAAMVLGALLGTQMSTKRRNTSTYRIERRCKVAYNEVPKKVLTGYLNKGILFGSEITKFSTQQLNTIDVSIQASW